MLKDCPSCVATCFICQSTQHIAKECPRRRKAKGKSRAKTSTPANNPNETLTEPVADPVKLLKSDANLNAPRLNRRRKSAPQPPPSSHADSVVESAAAEVSNGVVMAGIGNQQRRDTAGAKKANSPASLLLGSKTRRSSASGSLDHVLIQSKSDTDVNTTAGHKSSQLTADGHPDDDRLTGIPDGRNLQEISSQVELRTRKKKFTSRKNTPAAPPKEAGTTHSGAHSSDALMSASIGQPRNHFGVHMPGANAPRNSQGRRTRSQVIAIAEGKAISNPTNAPLSATGDAANLSEGKPVSAETLGIGISRSNNAGEAGTIKRRERNRSRRRSGKAGLSAGLGNLSVRSDGFDSAAGRIASSSQSNKS